MYVKLNNMLTDRTIWRNVIGYHSAPKYHSWLREKRPNQDVHHLLSSTFGKKFSDYIVVPLEHQFHITKVTANEAKYFPLLIDQACGWLKLYAESIGIKTKGLKNEPQIILDLINEIEHIEYPFYEFHKKTV
jgi:hypothetical protein